MVFRKSKRSAGKRNRKRVVRRRTKKSSSTEWASARQTLQLAPDAFGTIWRLGDGMNLAAFDRLALIGQAYQYFRFTKIQVRFLPTIDTFVQNATSSNTVPYLHWLINKGDSLDTNDFNALRDAGAKPIRFDDKTITVSYKPAVYQFVADNTAGVINPNYSMSKTSPWLATNQNAGTPAPVTWKASDVDHYGLIYGVEQDITPAGAGIPYNVEVTIYAQFKKPLNMPGGGTAVPVGDKAVVGR